MENNPAGLDGLDFIEFSSADPGMLEKLFENFGLTKIAKHKTKDVFLFRQSDINFILNNTSGSFAESFHRKHGPSICATGFRFKDAKKAFNYALSKGAKAYEGESKYPAIHGIGDSLIYFIDHYGENSIFDDDFEYIVKDKHPKGFNLFLIDHLTNNVPHGEMQKWCDFYKNTFNFREVRYFDIKGQQTGLISKVMKSPCDKIIIPINEPKDNKSQIQEYIEEYKGSGIQHLALLTKDIIPTVKKLRKQGIEFLDTPDTYYEVLKERVPYISEDVETLKDLRILADGDPEGYLLQIFTKNLVGPIFVEIIQRKNHFGFGEGNFQALFDSIERDQKRRGVL